MNIHKLAALGVLPMLLFVGCASGVGSSSSVRREVDTLKMEVADIQDSRRSVSPASSASGDVRVELGALRTDVQRLTESVETASMGGMTLRQQLEYIGARLDRLEKRANLKPLDTKVVAAVEPIPVITGGAVPGSVPPPPVAVNDPGMDPPPVDPALAGTPPLETPAVSGPYENGKTLFEQKNYSQAMAQFQAYLSAEPKGANASAAQFYVGEALYAQQQYADAILEYQKVITAFPKSSQVPTSLLKQGLSFQSMGDRDSAKLLYQKVVRDYPKSYAAGVAGERLKTL